MRNYDFLVVGGGIIGLTTARELRRRHPAASIAVFEKEQALGRHASGRNSGVLHSGIYYSQDTLKAKMCSNGAKRMMEFAEEHGVRYRRDGKVIVAADEKDLPGIDRLMKNARDNGIRAELLSEEEVRKIEPHARTVQKGIHCPDTAVIDSLGVLESLKLDLRTKNVEIRFNSPVVDIDASQKHVRTPQGDVSFGILFNCAGAAADRIAKKFNVGTDYTLIPFKGLYYKVRPERDSLVRANIYPVPDLNFPFLGVHLTRLVDGKVYAGPTAIPALGRENYGLLSGLRLGETLNILPNLMGLYFLNHNNFRGLVHNEIEKYIKPNFVRAVRRLVPEIIGSDLLPSGKVGIRPQLVNVRTKKLEMDYIVERTDHSIHVLNAISPAFTCSLAFAEWLVDKSENRQVVNVP
jgi:(S)-2-hydroxyglutarate dehydrogenase